MARLNNEAWITARADYEVRGLSYGMIAAKYGVNISNVSRKARAEGWEQGLLQPLADKKCNAMKELAEVAMQTQDLPEPVKLTLEDVVRERLRAEGLMASFDAALIAKGIGILKGVQAPEEWVAMTRGRRNLAPVEKPGVNVNVNQTSQTAVLPPPSAKASDALRNALRGTFEGDEE